MTPPSGPPELLRVAPGTDPALADTDPRGTPGFDGGKSDGKDALADSRDELRDLQERLFAETRAGVGDRSVLLVLQGMDTSGKDGTVKHVLSGLNPMGVKVYGFGRPSSEELDHDYLWRVHARSPARGEIGVFNRSHYEDVLTVLVNKVINAATARQRYRQINDFERMLTENGTIVVKCMLYISKAEQKRRLEGRLKDPLKNWKFQAGDLDARKQWGLYMRAYEAALGATSTPHAPWHVIPADRKWHRNLAVSEVLVQTLEAQRPRLSPPKPRMNLTGVRVV